MDNKSIRLFGDASMDFLTASMKKSEPCDRAGTSSVLVTGGAGYLGSHTVLELIRKGYRPVIFDNFSTSSEMVLPRLARICGREIPTVRGDVRNVNAVREVIQRFGVRAILHFAGLKAVAESVDEPLRYYDCNVGGLLSVLTAIQGTEARDVIFSSSATVYGDPDACPISEAAPLKPTNAYGHSKSICETILQDSARANDLRAVALRYFNPVGADSSGLIGEDPLHRPNNLMPFIAQVAAKRRERLSVFGSDYPTIDGTGVRDYVHVSDLAAGHVRALDFLTESSSGFTVLNLGTGHPVSVLQLINIFEQASGRRIPFAIEPRRTGDVAACWANPTAAEIKLGWRAARTVFDMCKDAWNWQALNPHGYRS